MLQQIRKESAFTLIELLVVVIIVAVLAAVGVPLLSANVARARATEAEAGLGTIRTAMRTYFAENQTYDGVSFSETSTNLPLKVTAGITGGDLDGRWFDDGAYTISADPDEYCISANGSTSDAPRNDQVKGTGLLQRSMNEEGNIGDKPCNGVNIDGTCLNCKPS